MRINLTGALTGGNSCHMPPSNSTASILRIKHGRQFRAKSRVTACFPTLSAMATMSMGLSGVENRDKLTMESSSSDKWV